MLLQVNDMHVTLSGLHIVQGVTMHMEKGELVVIVGANGAGKSTFLRALSGLNPYQEGTVILDGVDISHKPAYEMPGHGLVMVPEGRKPFPELSCKENLLIGAYHYHKDKERIEKNLRKVYELFPVLEEYQDRIAGTFSGGEQQMISIGRGLMSEAKVLMIDELSLGLAPKVIDMLFKIIKDLNSQGMSILLVEQNAKQALGIADRAYVMESGRVVLEGTGQDLLNNEHVKSAYLGL